MFINQVVGTTRRINVENLSNPEDKHNRVEKVTDEALEAQVLKNVKDGKYIEPFPENN